MLRPRLTRALRASRLRVLAFVCVSTSEGHRGPQIALGCSADRPPTCFSLRLQLSGAGLVSVGLL
jgi:hypothetical protein